MTQNREIRKTFFETLEREGVNSKARYEDLPFDLIESEELHNLSSGEKRQYFAEYITHIQKKERETARLLKQRSREQFSDFIEDWLQNEMSPDISFRQVATVCANMEFWRHLEIEELDDIFQDTVEDFNRRNRNLSRDRVYDLQREVYRAFESAEPPLVPGRDKWASVVDRFAANEAFSKLDDLDRFQVFEDFMREEMQKTRDNQRRDERRLARKYRQRFVELLGQFKNLITHSPDMKWSEFVVMIKDRPEYKDLIGTKNSSQPYDLFAEMRSKWKRDEEPPSGSGDTSPIQNFS